MPVQRLVSYCSRFPSTDNLNMIGTALGRDLVESPAIRACCDLLQLSSRSHSIPSI